MQYVVMWFCGNCAVALMLPYLPGHGAYNQLPTQPCPACMAFNWKKGGST